MRGRDPGSIPGMGVSLFALAERVWCFCVLPYVVAVFFRFASPSPTEDGLCGCVAGLTFYLCSIIEGWIKPLAVCPGFFVEETFMTEGDLTFFLRTVTLGVEAGE